MDIPHQSLEPETLDNVIIDYVTREGTDYGHSEIPLTKKVEKIKKMLEIGKIKITYDQDSETVNIIEVES